MRFIDFIEKSKSVDKRYLSGEKGSKLLNFLETGIPLDDLVSVHSELLKTIPLPQIKRLSDARRAWLELEKAKDNLVAKYEGNKEDLTNEIFSVALTSKRMDALSHILHHIPKTDFQSVSQWKDALQAALEVWTGAVNLSVKKGELKLITKDVPIPAKYEHLVGKRITLFSIDRDLWINIRQMENMGMVELDFSYNTLSIKSHLQKVSSRMGTRLSSMDTEELLQNLILSYLPNAIKQFYDHKIREEVLKFLASKYHEVLKTSPIIAPKFSAFYPNEDTLSAGMVVLSDKGKLLSYEDIELKDDWNDNVRKYFVKNRSHYVIVPFEVADTGFIHELRRKEGDFLAILPVRNSGIEEVVEKLTSVPEDMSEENKKAMILIRRVQKPLQEWSMIDPLQAIPTEYLKRDYNILADEETIRMYLREYRGMVFRDPAFLKIQPRMLPTTPPISLLSEKLNPNIHGIDEVVLGQKLQGVIINITKFGAFVNIGLSHEALIHVSEMTDRFINDPHEIVLLGDKITATVVSVDYEKNRISLSLLENPTIQNGPIRKRETNKPKRGEKYQSPAARSQALQDLENLFKK